jgi:GSH-dependent disulfide-bond oxidoreductase
MIDVYYWPTPNGHKITMFLEETGMDYRLVPVDIGKGGQFRPEFLAISPNNRMPAIVDHQPAAGQERNRYSNPASSSCASYSIGDRLESTMH